MKWGHRFPRGTIDENFEIGGGMKPIGRNIVVQCGANRVISLHLNGLEKGKQSLEKLSWKLITI